jgi:flagellar hook-length control protein FliK
MAIELQTTDSPLVTANGVLPINGQNGNGVPRSGGSFGEVLNTQAALFKIDDGKQSLNTAKLLSPDVAHANQLLSQSKAYDHSNAKSIQAFEANVHQVEYILAMKSVTDYKQGVTGTLPLATLAKFGQNISTAGVLGQMSSHIGSAIQVAPRSFANLNQKLDQAAFQISRDSADNTDEAESLAKADDLNNGDFLKNAPNHEKSHQHSKEPDEASPEELEVLGALAMNTVSNGIQDTTSSASNLIQLRMQSSISSPEWIAELAQKTIVMFGSDKHTAVITLNSADKGSLKIVLHIKGDQVNANFYSNDSEVLQAIQMGASNLKSSMLDAGLVLNQLNISSDTAYQQSAATVQGGSVATDGKPELTDLYSAKIVSFYA